MQPYKCVIVANGEFPEKELPLALLRQAGIVIACDGAIGRLEKAGIIPDAIVGDLDSIAEDVRIRYADRIHIIPSQEINDLTKAVRFAHQQGETEVLILGATGLREDHTLGNISLLMSYSQMFKRIEMLSDYGLFTPLTQSTRLQSRQGQQISLFSMAPEGKITTEGLRWEIDGRELSEWWQGTLNEAIGDHFSIILSGGAKILVYRNT